MSLFGGPFLRSEHRSKILFFIFQLLKKLCFKKSQIWKKITKFPFSKTKSAQYKNAYFLALFSVISEKNQNFSKNKKTSWKMSKKNIFFQKKKFFLKKTDFFLPRQVFPCFLRHFKKSSFLKKKIQNWKNPNFAQKNGPIFQKCQFCQKYQVLTKTPIFYVTNGSRHSQESTKRWKKNHKI